MRKSQKAKPVTIMDEGTKELIGIAASVATRCQPCLNFRLKRARESGVAESDIRKACEIADKISEVGGERMKDFANQLMHDHS